LRTKHEYINEVSVYNRPSHNDTEQFIKFHHYTLGPHESMGHM